MDKKAVLWLIAIVVGALLVGNLMPSAGTGTTAGKAAEPKVVETVQYSDLDRLLSESPQTVKKITFVNGKNEVIVEREGKPAVTVTVPDAGKEQLIKKATDAKVAVDAKAEAQKEAGPFDYIIALLFNFGPILLLLFVFFYLMPRMAMRNQGDMARQVTQSGTKKIEPDKDRKTFKDVAGCDEAKQELWEVVQYLKAPGMLKELGGRPPSGVLLVGPPGNGKTLLAKAVAGEAGVAFFPISASQFVELFVGVGAARVRDLFNQARQNKPCVIFIDELDAVGRQRGAGIGGGHDEREQTLNQLLVEMDGFAGREGIIMMAATNRPDILDPALTRPGRFDRQILVDHADVEGREKIFRIHIRGKKVGPDVNLRLLAERTPGFSGAEIEGACNEAATVAARRINETVASMREQAVKERLAELLADESKRASTVELMVKSVGAALRAGNKHSEQSIDALLAGLRAGGDVEAAAAKLFADLRGDAVEFEQVMKALLVALPNGGLKVEQDIQAAVLRVITMADFDEGLDRVQMGVARTSRAKAMSAEDLNNTAIHELGHALLSELLKHGDPVTKITIMPRSRALGYTQALPQGDRFNYTREQLLARIIMAMGGRAAQEVLLGTVDTGAQNDFKQGWSIARRMVTEFGMSDLGPIHVSDDGYGPFLGKAMAMPSGIGSELANAIDRETACIANQCLARAKELIQKHAGFMVAAADVLLKKETLLAPEWQALLADNGIATHKLEAEIACGSGLKKSDSAQVAADFHASGCGACADRPANDNRDTTSGVPAEPLDPEKTAE